MCSHRMSETLTALFACFDGLLPKASTDDEMVAFFAGPDVDSAVMALVLTVVRERNVVPISSKSS